MAALGETSERPGVGDFYRAVARAVGDRLDEGTRRRLAIAVEVGLVLSYLVLRSTDAGRPMLVAWTLALALVALVAPASALVALVAVAPYTEWLQVNRDVGVKVLVVPAIGLGLLVRLAAGTAAGAAAGAASAAEGRRVDRRVDRLAVLTALLWAGLALSVAHAAVRFGPAFGERAAATWAAGLGGGLVLFAAAWWASERGSVRVLVVAAGTIVVAGAASLVDYLADGAVRASLLDWLLRPSRDAVRLTGIIPAPNAVATLAMAGIGALAAPLLFGRARWRVLLPVPLILLAAVVVLTFSRSGIAGAAVLVVGLAAWWRPRAGLVVLVAIAGLAVVLVPLYLRLRSDAVGAGATLDPGSLLARTDIERLTAWLATFRLWLDFPLTGAGFLAFRELHAQYGSPAITAPHNELLRLLAEAGPLVAAAAVAWAAAVVRRLWRAHSVTALAALGALIAIAVGGSYNNPFLYIQLTAVIFPIIGAGIGLASVPSPFRSPRGTNDGGTGAQHRSVVGPVTP